MVVGDGGLLCSVHWRTLPVRQCTDIFSFLIYAWFKEIFAFMDSRFFNILFGFCANKHTFVVKQGYGG